MNEITEHNQRKAAELRRTRRAFWLRQGQPESEGAIDVTVVRVGSGNRFANVVTHTYQNLNAARPLVQLARLSELTPTAGDRTDAELLEQVRLMTAADIATAITDARTEEAELEERLREARQERALLEAHLAAVLSAEGDLPLLRTDLPDAVRAQHGLP